MFNKKPIPVLSLRPPHLTTPVTVGAQTANPMVAQSPTRLGSPEPVQRFCQ